MPTLFTHSSSNLLGELGGAFLQGLFVGDIQEGFIEVKSGSINAVNALKICVNALGKLAVLLPILDKMTNSCWQ